ncbi:MAG: DinB family protein [Candidatus Odinarchaeota archaeon]
MEQIKVYLQLWEDLRQHGLKTIELIEKEQKWDFSVMPEEHSIRGTFQHTLKAIFEETSRFTADKTLYDPLDDPRDDLNRVMTRIIKTIESFHDQDLGTEYIFPWGKKTTLAGAIHQILFHTAGHFAQLRNWIGISKRSQTRK